MRAALRQSRIVAPLSELVAEAGIREYPLQVVDQESPYLRSSQRCRYRGDAGAAVGELLFPPQYHLIVLTAFLGVGCLIDSKCSGRCRL